MPLVHLEALVEELSMAAVLECLLPKLVGGATYELYPHRGRDDLFRKLPARLRAYQRMLRPGWLVLVLVDRDRDDCIRLKKRMEEAATTAGLPTRTTRGDAGFLVLNRIAVEELEAWYFGDWQAVTTAYPRVPASIPNRDGYRSPDAIAGGTWEALERIMRRAGYFHGGLAKVEAARRIAPHMDPARNTSRSFHALRDALLEAARA